ncbi:MULTISPECIES: AraC family transcriptional regulator [Methylobacterium]|uniref:AraC family transcriptional regulator n=1 Tax=Methylobacterium TaxID=407 RepID=UPI000DAB073C|nr:MULTISPECIES: AraC family transcriptional regulator [unclassified Methylobacterium]AWV15376.1 AraC family transcriptional regulator [Methylobacterium sp. XJLW]WFS07052.1 AraC family transcriptional regulator [Methylobacterium sp. 391_Methyba4]
MDSTPETITYATSGSSGHLSGRPELTCCAPGDRGLPEITFIDFRFATGGWSTHAVSGLEVAASTQPAGAHHEVDYEIAARLSDREGLLVRRPGLHGTTRWDGPYTGRVLSFSAVAVERLAEAPIGKIAFATDGRDLRACRSTCHILSALSYAHRDDPSPDPLLIESLHLAVLRSVIAVRTAGRSAGPDLSASQAGRACAYIREHLDREITVSALAGIVGLSEGYFIRAFRQSTGVTPYQYIMRERVGRAEALIRSGAGSMAEVAARSGFTSAGAMSRTFRKLVGRSPTGRTAGRRA